MAILGHQCLTLSFVLARDLLRRCRPLQLVHTPDGMWGNLQCARDSHDDEGKRYARHRDASGCAPIATGRALGNLTSFPVVLLAVDHACTLTTSGTFP
nr:hypothetical protein CFP56_12351 [Quercus suber]